MRADGPHRAHAELPVAARATRAGARDRRQLRRHHLAAVCSAVKRRRSRARRERSRLHHTRCSRASSTCVAIAVDADGVEGQARAQLKVRDGADKLAPVVRARHRACATRGCARPTPISGTVADSNLDFWRLEIAPASVAGSGPSRRARPTADGVLAMLDPRTLTDGFYMLRLTARDIGGRTSTATRASRSTATTKLGQYHAR